ncbi:MAG: NAD(P)-dependent oxidoreductase, partial [Candidatus Eremiobacteraeota bacterium]|nr:NAD(P)-dependent oxidoreductase [Candidatus Eremiobacteraeota bacterium]
MRRIAITGGAGEVAALVRPHLSQRYELRLSDRRTATGLRATERFVRADLRSPRQLYRALDGCDAVIHLGGIPREDRFERLLEMNVRATQTLLDAARSAGIRRVVIASTGHVTGFYPRRVAIDETDPVRP